MRKLFLSLIILLCLSGIFYFALHMSPPNPNNAVYADSVDLYWDDNATHQWGDTGVDSGWYTATNGGGSQHDPPTATNNVYFDAGSPNCTVDAAAYAKTLTTTGFNGTIAIGAYYIILYNGTSTLSATTTITSNAGECGIFIGNTGGTVTLNANGATLTSCNIVEVGVDSLFVLSSDATIRNFYHYGSLDLGGNTFTCGTVIPGNSFFIGSGVLNCSSFSIAAGRTVTATATINCSGNFSGGGVDYSSLTAVNLTGTGLLSGVNTFSNLGVGASGVITGTEAQTVTNDLTVTAGATMTGFTGPITMTGADGTGTITTNGVTLASPITINAPGATVTPGSDLNIGSNTLTLTAGTFDTSAVGNYAVTCGTMDSDNSTTRALNLNDSTIICGRISFATTTNLTLNAGTSDITTTNNAIFCGSSGGGGETFYDVAIIPNNDIFYWQTVGCTFNNLSFSGPANNTTTIQLYDAMQSNTVTNTPTITGNSAVNRLWVQSNTLGTTATLTVNGTVNISNADLMDLNGVGEGFANGLVTNGQFTSVTTGWTPGSDSGPVATLSSEAGGLSGNCLKVLNSAGTNYGWAYQTITTVIGHSYTFKAWAKEGNLGQCQLKIGSNYPTTTGDLYGSGVVSPGSGTVYSSTFTATTTSSTILFISQSDTDGDYTLFDSVQLIDNSVGGGALAGDSGITFKAPETIVWDNGNGTGLFNDPLNWVGHVVPIMQDTCDFNGAIGTVTMNMRIYPAIDASGASSGTLSFGSPTYFWGNQDWSTLTGPSSGEILYFYGRSNANFKPPTTMDINRWYMKGIGATVTLTGNLTEAGVQSNIFGLVNGTFDANGYNVTSNTNYMDAEDANKLRTCLMGEGIWYGQWSAGTSTNLTLTPETSTIKLTGSGTSVWVQGGGLTYNNLTFAPASDSASTVYSVTGNNTFSGTVNCDTTLGRMKIAFPASGNTTVGDIKTTGIVNKVNIASSTPGTRFTMTRSAAGVSAIRLNGGYFFDGTYAGPAGTRFIFTNCDSWLSTHPTGGSVVNTGLWGIWNPGVLMTPPNIYSDWLARKTWEVQK